MKKLAAYFVMALCLGFGLVYAQERTDNTKDNAAWFQKGAYLGPDGTSTAAGYVNANRLGSSYATTVYLDFPAVDAGCKDLSRTLTGAALGDICVVGAPSDSVLVSGTAFTCYVTAANTVTIRYCSPEYFQKDPSDGGYQIRTFGN